MADIRLLVEPTPAIRQCCEVVIWNCLEFTHAAVLAEDNERTTSPALTDARINAMSSLIDLSMAIEHAAPSRFARALNYERDPAP